MIKIVIGLASVMLANICFGITLAKIKKEFKREKLLNGVIKYIGILLGVLFMLLAGYLNQDIVVATMDNINVNLMTCLKILFISGITYYGIEDLNKLRDLLGIKVEATSFEKGRG